MSKQKSSIREKVVIYYFLLGLIAIIALGIYAYNSAYKAILDRSYNQLVSVREVKKRQIETFFTDRSFDAKFLAQTNEIKALFTNVRESDTVGVLKQYFEKNSVFFEFLTKNKYYNNLYLVYPHYTVSFGRFPDCSSIRIQYGTFHKNITKQSIKKGSDSSIFISDYQTIDSSKNILIATPIINHRKVREGVLMLSVPESVINHIMLENNEHSGLGSSGETYLVGKDYLMRSQSRFLQKSTMRVEVKTQTPVNTFAGKQSNRTISDYRNISVLSTGSLLNIPHLHWMIVAELDIKEVMIPVETIRNDIIFISSIITIIMLIVAFIISQRITTPLIRLNDAVNEIIKGKYGLTVLKTTSDEIGDLTDSFNRMSHYIEHQTHELRESERRLQHFNDATKDGILLYLDNKPILVNQALATMTGFSVDELMKLSVHEIYSRRNMELPPLHSNKVLMFESECHQKTKYTIPVEVQERPLLYEGRLIYSTVLRDISERLSAQTALNEEREMRLSSFFDGQENERKRVSRELHDGIGQSLIAIKMRMESLEMSILPNDSAQTIDITKRFVNQTIDDIRRISNNLMPSVLSEFGLVIAINNLVKQLTENSSFTINFEHRNISKNLDKKIQMYLYRISQEALNNAIKYASATEINILLMQDEHSIRLLIEDNGCGFLMNDIKKTSNGLYNMRERVGLLHGKINIESTQGQGTTIQIKIPLQ